MMKKFYFILNPASRRGQCNQLLLPLKQWLSEHLPNAPFISTQRNGHAGEIAQQAAKDGFDPIISVGGDGTLNEVANGILAMPKAKRPAIGLISAGTGGDFSRMLKEKYLYPKNRDFSWLLRAREVWIDAGKATLKQGRKKTRQRYFINLIDAGMAGEVVRRVNNSKKRLGSLEYLRFTLLSALCYRPPRVRITCLENSKKLFEAELNLLFAIAANGAYCGGGMCLAPKAQLNDQRLEFMIVEKVPYTSLLRHLPRIYLKQPIPHPKVHYCAGKTMRIEALHDSFSIDIDGDCFQAEEAVFELMPKALKILVPGVG